VTKPMDQKTASRKSAPQPSKPATKKAASKAQDQPITVRKTVAKSAATTSAKLKPGPISPTAKTAATEAPGAAVTATPTTSKMSGSRAQSGPDSLSSFPKPSTSGSRFADRFAPRRVPTQARGPLSHELTRASQTTDPQLANAWKTKPGREMSEAEILAMPDSEYMNEKQLDFFRARLQSQKDSLLSNAGETTEHLREDTSIVPDPADRATIEEEHALELRTRDRERKLLKKISQCLLRIENGEYGFCDETGEPIGLGRLLARPTATLSFEAQQRRELQQKMFGD